MAKFRYQIMKQDKVTILVMTEGITDLVRNALEIVNPDDPKVEEVARGLALELEQK